ncbi:MAG: NAD(P)H-hydrate dehydratase [Firmicutes bacterium]|nr:NAD(P)H-hydrate dehydratase [Bacillota bacterium]MDD4707924.1 NAD(P)H-hydrate dehydratase [Bacillota bacterium]
MRVVTPKQMRGIDKVAMEKYGIPGIVLMENAGIRVAEEVIKLAGGRGKGVVMLAGKGNNGGDVMVAARHLLNNGLPVRVFLLGKPGDLKGDAGLNAGILTRMGIPIEVLLTGEDLIPLDQALRWGHAVVDGIFGTGLKREVEGLFLDVIRAVNKSGCTIVSVDIPSGIDGETGRISGECIHASVTVTLGLPKSGLLQYPGAEHVGRLVVADISIPRATTPESGPDMVMLTRECISGIIPQRKPDAHKGDCGRVAVIGGAEGMTGAVVLASLGCLKSGAGLVRAALPGALNYVLENNVIEAVSVPLGEGTRLKLDRSTKSRLREILDWADAVALGPGMGVDGDRVRFLEFVLTNARVPLILDADALNCLALDMKLLERAAVPVVVTPHPGEMARLTSTETGDIQRDRIKAAKAFAEKWGTVTVLKGANSVIAHPKGNIYINTSGNPGMASGGSGDVLTGIIASFVAQGLDPVKSACAAVYIHGRAGDLMAEERGVYGLTATGLADFIPMAVKAVKQG